MSYNLLGFKRDRDDEIVIESKSEKHYYPAVIGSMSIGDYLRNLRAKRIVPRKGSISETAAGIEIKLTGVKPSRIEELACNPVEALTKGMLVLSPFDHGSSYGVDHGNNRSLAAAVAFYQKHTLVGEDLDRRITLKVAKEELDLSDLLLDMKRDNDTARTSWKGELMRSDLEVSRIFLKPLYKRLAPSMTDSVAIDMVYRIASWLAEQGTGESIVAGTAKVSHDRFYDFKGSPIYKSLESAFEVKIPAWALTKNSRDEVFAALDKLIEPMVDLLSLIKTDERMNKLYPAKLKSGLMKCLVAECLSGRLGYNKKQTDPRQIVNNLVRHHAEIQEANKAFTNDAFGYGAIVQEKLHDRTKNK